MARTIEACEHTVQRQNRSLGANTRLIGDTIESRWYRWHHRQPVYLSEVGRVLRGKPECIERNAILLFY